MKRTLSYVTLLLLAGTALADKQPTGTVMLVPAAKLKFEPVPGFKGAAMAAVEGDPSKGPSHFMIRFDKGFEAPLHHHTADHYVTVTGGSIVLTVDGKATTLPAGSFFSITGMKPHVTKCTAAGECTLSIDSRGAWDVIPEGTSTSMKP